MLRSLVGSEMCIRDRYERVKFHIAPDRLVLSLAAVAPGDSTNEYCVFIYLVTILMKLSCSRRDCTTVSRPEVTMPLFRRTLSQRYCCCMIPATTPPGGQKIRYILRSICVKIICPDFSATSTANERKKIPINRTKSRPRRKDTPSGACYAKPQLQGKCCASATAHQLINAPVPGRSMSY